jgi:hypothetical protein
MTIPDQHSTPVVVWWMTISAISIANVAAWLWVVAPPRPDGHVTRRWQSVLSALFVLGCAFRSFLPRAEALRICLYDSWLSSALIGRSVATIAELCFVAQWTLVLDEWTRAAATPFGTRVSRLLLPLIAVAELCSWYSALTTNFLGSVLEESIWAITAALVISILAGLWAGARSIRRSFLGAALVLAAAYAVFMCTVDVPMYVARWKADQAAGRLYLSLREGWRDARSRRIVTLRCEDWREEVPWMSLYFSAGVWLSIALIRAPQWMTRDRRPTPLTNIPRMPALNTKSP